jgi:hypothetical protein
VWAKRSTARARRPSDCAPNGSHFFTAPERSSTSCARRCGWPPVPASSAKVTGASSAAGSCTWMRRQPGSWRSARASSASRSRVDGLRGVAGARALSAAGRAGGRSPTARYTRSLAHGYEITAAEATTTASGSADQTPITLCQLKSRALPVSPRRNQVTLRSCTRVHRRGSHR